MQCMSYPFCFWHLDNSLRVVDGHFVATEVSIRRNITVGLPTSQGPELTSHKRAGWSSRPGLERLLSSYGQYGMLYGGCNSSIWYSARDLLESRFFSSFSRDSSAKIEVKSPELPALLLKSARHQEISPLPSRYGPYGAPKDDLESTREKL